MQPRMVSLGDAIAAQTSQMSGRQLAFYRQCLQQGRASRTWVVEDGCPIIKVHIAAKEDVPYIVKSQPWPSS